MSVLPGGGGCFCFCFSVSFHYEMSYFNPKSKVIFFVRPNHLFLMNIYIFTHLHYLKKNKFN